MFAKHYSSYFLNFQKGGDKMAKPNTERRLAERKIVETELDVNIIPDNLEATSVNISETGICFDTESALEIDIKFKLAEKNKSKIGRLIWAKKKPDGGYTYGFEYIS